MQYLCKRLLSAIFFLFAYRSVFFYFSVVSAGTKMFEVHKRDMFLFMLFSFYLLWPPLVWGVFAYSFYDAYFYYIVLFLFFYYYFFFNFYEYVFWQPNDRRKRQRFYYSDDFRSLLDIILKEFFDILKNYATFSLEGKNIVQRTLRWMLIFVRHFIWQ